MATKLTRLTHKIAIQLYLVAESCTICSSRCRRPVRKLLDTPSYFPISFYAAMKYSTVQTRQLKQRRLISPLVLKIPLPAVRFSCRAVSCAVCRGLLPHWGYRKVNYVPGLVINCYVQAWNFIFNRMSQREILMSPRSLFNSLQKKCTHYYE
jgi:hypothetical protein